MKSAFVIFLIAGVGVALALFSLQHDWHPLSPHAKADRVLVEKRARRLTLFSGSKSLKSYRVALGGSPVGPKESEGDRRTPEGRYVIDRHKEDSAFHRALHISYPDADDLARAEKKGLPAGSDIMIHGLPNGWGWIGAFHRGRDWTAGCIAVTDRQIEEICRAVPDGTPIDIRP